jgi:D-alanyl-D-alanine-carboxypeptidase/D-alanyl-D-alanine-endopeptidase
MNPLREAVRSVGIHRVVTSTAFVCVLSVTALAQNGVSDLDARVARLAEPIVREHKTVGISIGILDGQGVRHTYGFGRVSKDEDRRPDRDTLFEIGSITKCFTSILLAEMDLRREVRLNEPVEQFLPRWAQVPRVDGRPMTLEELATYSSGLPRMPANFGRTERERARYSPRQMLEFLAELARRESGPGPNRHYLYSNLGFALLGHCLAERAQEPVRTLIIRRVVRPLRMESTYFEPGPKLVDRVAKAYNQAGEPVPPWETGAIAPAGMLRSTARDMLTVVAANVDRIDTPLREAIHLTQQPRYQTGTTKQDPHNLAIGLAWFINPETGIIQHNGATNGSSADLIFDPQTKIGVVVLMNQQRAPATRLANQIMRLLNDRYKTDPRLPPGADDNGL